MKEGKRFLYSAKLIVDPIIFDKVKIQDSAIEDLIELAYLTGVYEGNVFYPNGFGDGVDTKKKLVEKLNKMRDKWHHIGVKSRLPHN